MPASNSHIEGRGKLGHGVLAALHVPRRGSRWPGTAGRLPEDGPDAAGPWPRGRQQRRRSQDTGVLDDRQREQRERAGKSSRPSAPGARPWRGCFSPATTDDGGGDVIVCLLAGDAAEPVAG
jgi:hypothetical protein